MMGMNEITGGKLFPLFTGQQDVDKIRQNGEELISFVHRLNLDTLEMDDCRCSIHEGTSNALKMFLTMAICDRCPLPNFF